jgi:hypothetical protein
MDGSAAEACANAMKRAPQDRAPPLSLQLQLLILDVFRASNESTRQDAALCNNDPDLGWWGTPPFYRCTAPSGVIVENRWPLAVRGASCSGGARQGAVSDESAGEEWAVSC